MITRITLEPRDMNTPNLTLKINKKKRLISVEANHDPSPLVSVILLNILLTCLPCAQNQFFIKKKRKEKINNILICLLLLQVVYYFLRTSLN